MMAALECGSTELILPSCKLVILGSCLLTDGASIFPGHRMRTKMKTMVIWKWKGKQ